MNGLQLAKDYCEICRPILMERVPDLMEQAALGLAGEGSECFGLDDHLSEDHDFGPGFCVWLPDELARENSERIQYALAGLPENFRGYPSRMRGGGRVGFMGIAKFYQSLTGLDRPPQTAREWLPIPESGLACAVNGEVFEDRAGLFSAWREKLLAYYPEDARLKKIAARAMIMAQAGQYNLPRSLERGDGAAAMLAQARFAEAALSFVYLLNRRYAPYYKLAPRLLAQLPVLGGELRRLLLFLAASPLARTPEAIEEFCGQCARILREHNLSSARDSWLWAHGPSIASRINNPEIRAGNLLSD